VAVTSELGLFGPNGFRLDPALWAPAGVRGADKVAARYAYFLMTPTGTIPGRANDGSPFVAVVQTFRSEFDVFAAFAAADAAAARSVRAAEAATDPPSERYGSARLTGVTIASGELTMALEITAADGSHPAAPVQLTVYL